MSIFSIRFVNTNTTNHILTLFILYHIVSISYFIDKIFLFCLFFAFLNKTHIFCFFSCFLIFKHITINIKTYQIVYQTKTWIQICQTDISRKKFALTRILSLNLKIKINVNDDKELNANEKFFHFDFATQKFCNIYFNSRSIIFI